MGYAAPMITPLLLNCISPKESLQFGMLAHPSCRHPASKHAFRLRSHYNLSYASRTHANTFLKQYVFRLRNLYNLNKTGSTHDGPQASTIVFRLKSIYNLRLRPTPCQHHPAQVATSRKEESSHFAAWGHLGAILEPSWTSLREENHRNTFRMNRVAGWE